MTRRAVLICPGRGTYNKAELGYLARHHGDKAQMLAGFDAIRQGEGQDPVTTLDGTARFSASKHLRGDNASPLIYSCALADAQSLADDIEVVAVTGNSMGWYIALAAAGALGVDDGFRVVNTMGRLMHETLIGGQVIYPVVGDDWRPDPACKADLLDVVAGIDARDGHDLALSIDLGGMLVFAGNERGLAAFEASVPPRQPGYPMRLPGHSAFHTAMQAPVSERGQAALARIAFGAPVRPLIDGRGAIWWPQGCDTDALRAYTLGHQVTEPYDFARAITVAAREFAPDLFIITGPGATMGGAVAQSLIGCDWLGISDKAGFQQRQARAPYVLSMGRDDQRPMALAVAG